MPGHRSHGQVDYRLLTASIKRPGRHHRDATVSLGLRGAVSLHDSVPQSATLPDLPPSLHVRRTGLTARLEAQAALLAVARDEVARMEPLVRDGYLARNRLKKARLKVREIEARLAPLRRELMRLAPLRAARATEPEAERH